MYEETAKSTPSRALYILPPPKENTQELLKATNVK